MERSLRSVPRGWGDGRAEKSLLRRPRHLTIAVLIAFLLLMVGSAFGATLTVGPEEKIQAAIDQANAGDTVLVESGVYGENLVLDKKITLQGSGRPLIDARGSGSALILSSEGAKVQGFEVSGSGPGERDAGIRVMAENCAITDNLVVENNIGILLQDVNGCLIERNEVEGNDVGVYLEASYGNEILSNQI